MSKYNLTYVNAEQFVEDMATAIIKEHLDWSGTLEKDSIEATRVLEVRGEAFDAWDNWFVDSFDKEGGFDWDCEAHRKILAFTTEREFIPMLKEAMKLANRKWDAARLFLGI